MAPGFLSKFTRPSHSRNSSSSRPTSPLTAEPPPLPIPSIIASARGVDSDSVSVNPSVTIGVVPPSPRGTINSTLLGSDTASVSAASLQDRRRSASTASSARPQDLALSTRTPTDFSSEDGLPTPVPGKGGHGRLASPSREQQHPPLPRTISVSSSTGDLRQFVKQAEANFPQDMFGGSNANRQASANRSTPPIAISSSHGRSGTTPATYEARADVDEMGTLLNGVPISESPTRMSHAAPGPSIDALARAPTSSQNMLSPGARDADSASIISSKKRTGWRKPTLPLPTKKPTGLASAIAASGLAMANPTMSAQHLAHTHMQTPMNISPSTQTHPPANGNGTANASAQQRKGSAGASAGRKSRHAASASVASIGTTPAMLDAPNNARGRSASVSNRSDNSEGVYDSGLDGAWSDADSSNSSDGLDLREDMDIPVTGFAVASNKRNADFHELFPGIPEGDYLIEDYGCALQREILIQGRIYISENHICFHANIFGWITDLSIPIYEIVSLEKKMTAFVIPNAIQITTRQAKYAFASFLSRDTTYDVIHNIWRLARPEDRDTMSIASGGKSARGSIDRARAGMDEVRQTPSSIDVALDPGSAGPRSPKEHHPTPALLENKVTQCACGKKGEHYTETALETIVPGTPDKIYNLMFASGFIKNFMTGEQKLMDLQISDWMPTSPGSKLLARNMSYIKPLYGSLGPKQTKCEIRDETTYCDFEDYVVVITTTRTPDVPSGGVFAVKTRTCITWASAASSRIVVTTQVEWTGRSFIKGIIESSAIAGQKTYHADMDKAMRVYIQAHQGEFVPAGVEALAVAPVEPQTSSVELAATAFAGAVPDGKAREKERNQRSLQWAYDTLEGAYNVAKQSTMGALELISDAWDQSTSTTILIFVIVVLVFSNLWTLTKLGRREDVGRRKEMQKTVEKEKWVQGIVTALWDELAAGKGIAALPAMTAPVAGDNWREEFANINKTLDAVEDRIRRIRETLNALD